MIIRIQSTEGTKRVEIKPTESTKLLFEKAHDTFGLSGFNFALYTTRDRKNEIVSSPRKTIKGYKLSHGDMIYLHSLDGPLHIDDGGGTNHSIPGPSTSAFPGPSTSAIPGPSTSRLISNGKLCRSSHEETNKIIKNVVNEDEVDKILVKEGGRIDRKKNPQLCHHGSHSKCIHCTPLDPWDEGHLKEQNIKHLSFHSYVRKISSGVDKGKFTCLEDVDCKIKSGCREHPPWPKGICSKCQPSAITLNRQAYRHVDNIMFENPAIVERFINYWRVTGHQRVGFMYGRYEPHLDVPLGIKAVVMAIYEPPQESSRDHVKFLPDPKKEVVEEIARNLGLQCVGWIFTDLVPLDASAGTVCYSRHAETIFLSAHEVITAAYFQNLYPNPCKLSPSGTFGSKFTTVIVTGDKNNQVHMEGYQVSNQGQSVVRDKCLIPTKDSPELAYIRESSSNQYVPDIYFKEKDEYKNEVVRLGRPLPVEYLLLDCPVSTPNEPLYSFSAHVKPFPVANRMVEGHLQDFNALAMHLQKINNDQFLEAVSDLHILIFISTMDMLPLKEYIGPLLEAVKNKDKKAATNWKKSEHWATVEQLIMASGVDGAAAGTSVDVAGRTSTPSSGTSTSWTCQHCTFINQTTNENCDMCHLPR